MNKMFVMPQTGHVAKVGSIVIFEIGSNYPLVGIIDKLYTEEDMVYAVIKQPSGRSRTRNLEYDAKNGSIALLTGDDEKMIQQWFKTITD